MSKDSPCGGEEMTPKQWIKYVRWLEKNNLAICDGTTADPASFIDVIHTAIIVGGATGLFGAVYYKLRGKL